jgi:hypothetical protein
VGRYWVALSLAEAETVRRILHIRKKKTPLSLINNATTEVPLGTAESCSMRRGAGNAREREPLLMKLLSRTGLLM